MQKTIAILSAVTAVIAVALAAHDLKEAFKPAK